MKDKELHLQFCNIWLLITKKNIYNYNNISIYSVRESKRLKYKILQSLHANQVTLKNEKSANHYYTLVFK